MNHMFRNIRKKKVFKFVAAYLAMSMLAQIVAPTAALALTSGPSQVEFQSFEPAGTSDMVDMFSGDFTYNLPLFDLPGPDGSYPFNLAYHSGINMEQEASWVGLGWNINPGAINRDKRGLPDEFSGDIIETTTDMKPDETFGGTVGANLELWGGDGSASGTAGLSISIYNNSYKGMGYSFDPSFGMTSEGGAGLNLGLSLDSQEGVGASADVSYEKTSKEGKAGAQKGSVGVGASFNSQRGLSASISGSYSKSSHAYKSKDKKNSAAKLSGSSSYSFSEQAFMPAFSTSMQGKNLQIALKLGADLGGVFGDITVGGFYRGMEIKDEEKSYAAFGYNYLENANDGSLMDFNREKDGAIRKESPNLPSPVLTHDSYMAYGQGFMGNYRAHRSDVGHLHDPYVESRIWGGSIGVDLGFGQPFHLGVAASFNETVMNSGDWEENNDWNDGNDLEYNYKNASNNAQHNYENIYYKVKGEPTSYDHSEMDFIGGQTAVRANLQRAGSAVSAYYHPQESTIVQRSGTQINTTSSIRDYSDGRVRRDNSVQPITNELLLDGSSELLGEYQVDYYTSTSLTDYHYGTPTSFNRSSLKPMHNAGFSCINPEGMRYVYALPVYNTSETEDAFTYDNSSNTYLEDDNYITTVVDGAYDDNEDLDGFKSKTITPDYAHSYLLTSVLGTDYVDLTGNGPSDDDYGYWVKFNYVKTESAYNWRTPFSGALYMRGMNTKNSDDKAMINSGVKEVWMLASAETKSHIAVFSLSERKDGFDASTSYNGGIGSNTSQKLDRIDLFSKDEYATVSPVVPLKTVHFDYTYDLCGNVPNNDGSAVGGTNYHTGIDRNLNKGKLTLKKVWFTYQKNYRGALSPYVFDYGEGTSGDATAENPDYNADNYDRWGSYVGSTDYFNAKNYPYTTQFDPNTAQNPTNKATFKADVDQNAAVWNLKKIDLPTGGSIEVDYEADDYAYVQHRQATQMFQIKSMYDDTQPNKVYAEGTGWDHTSNGQRKIYFKLEHPVLVSTANDQEIFDNYIAPLRQENGAYQMYFRINADLRDGAKENVVGYCNLKIGSALYGYGTSTISISGNNYYDTGFITLDLLDGNNSVIPGTGKIEYHPFAVAAWQYMRINYPEMLTAYGTLPGAAAASDMDKAMKVKSLLSVFPAIVSTLTGYRKYAFNHNWGKSIECEKSFIRLGSPDKIKFGGGLRVKKITYNDNWNDAASGEISNSYGQVYTYTTTEGTGANEKTISSGVAQYEPLVGGDEIALRHAKTYPQTIPLFTANNLFYEYPINESYYPGASVGYSKVTVQSIASKNSMPGGSADPEIPTTGMVEYQFYTAKDFPVITEETDNQVRKFDLWIPLPLVGQITANKLFETQGYAIILNDMHGKLKSITNYAKNINGEIVTNSPTSSVSYEYKFDYKTFDGQTVKVLNNLVENAIVNEAYSTSSPFKQECVKKDDAVIMGEEYDFFVDSRQSHIFSAQGGLALNIEWTVPYITIPCPWPSISSHKKDLRTLVTNKIINKSGILISTTATDGQSVVKTENKLFDAQTGTPLLTVVTNDFNNPIYNYEHPAYWDYDNMGQAAENHNYTFHAIVESINTTNNTFRINNEDAATATAVTINSHTAPTPLEIDENDFYNTIAEGDEVIAEEGTIKWKTTLIRKSITHSSSCGKVYNLEFHPKLSSVSASDEIKMTIVRSGRRNMLTTNTGSIAALKDPTNNANRGVSSGSTTAAVGTIATELADLLNNLLATDISAPHELPITTVDFSSGTYYDSNGDPIYPILSSIFNFIEIKTHYLSCDGNQFPVFYIHYSYIKENGSCTDGNCYCLVKWGVGWNNGLPTTIYDIDHFTANPSTGTITTHYNGGISSYTSPSLSTCMTLGATAKLTYMDDVISSSSVLERDYWDYDGLNSVAIPDVSQTNLYSLGKKGIWKPYKNYYYKDERVNQLLTADVNIDHDGVYRGTGTIGTPAINEFYFFNWKPTLERPQPVEWMPNSLVSMYDQNSNAVQTRDIVNIYSAVQYGYNGKLPIIQGNNARQGELFSEGFEDASSPIYLSFSDAASGNYGLSASTAIAHSGVQSFSATGNSTVLEIKNINLQNSPYVLSLWMSQNAQPWTYANTGDDVAVKIKYYDATGTALPSGTPQEDILEPSGNVIEKWQRIEGAFTPPSGTIYIKITFRTDADMTGTPITNYFDDFRIFPKLSNVSTSVYDPNNFRIKAVLDANNYATFYNYDEEGKLFMVKKETTDGIKTIKEERGHIRE